MVEVNTGALGTDDPADECTLCGLPTPDPPVTGEGAAGTYCCRGCLEVAKTLDDAEAADPEAVRESAAPDTADADGEAAYVQVEGMHCATCEAFLEGEAAANEGVEAVDASYASGMLKFVYDDEQVDESELPDLVDGLGYRAHRADEPADDEDKLVGRLLVGGFFGMMTMLWYVLFLYPPYLGAPPDTLLMDVTGPSGGYLLGNVWVMSTVVLGYTGYPMLRGAYVSLRAGRPNMDLLVALAATTAYVYSTLAAATGHVEVYFDVSVVVIMAVSLGNYYEDRIRERAAGKLASLAEERVTEATRRVDGATETVPVEKLGPGDEVVVGAGERVPVDGTVVEGTAAVDNALVTGESLPARVEPGEEVIGGAVVTDGGLVVEPDAGGESTLDRLLNLLWEVRSTRPGAQRLADRIAAVFVPLVVALATVTVFVHLYLGATATGAMLTGLAVLVVSCPCALGLATPLAVAAGIREALDRGIVVGDGEVFERAVDVDVVALDKTGTLTTGKMAVVERAGADRAVERAAAVEQFADHPVADAVVEHVAERTDLAAPGDHGVTDFETHPGRGVSAVVGATGARSAAPDRPRPDGSGGRADSARGVLGADHDGGERGTDRTDGSGDGTDRTDGDRVLVGRAELFDERGVAIPADLRDRAEAAGGAGQVPVLVGWGDRARAVLVAGDDPRPDWDRAVEDLATDRRVVVISGDSPEATAQFRDHEAVDETFAGVPPEAKAEVIERLRAEGTVAMVGDGSNDAPALGTADVGIAMGGGTALASDAADAVVTDDDLASVPAVFALTAGTKRRIRTNLGWAFLYNAIALPVAAVGLLNPLIAALAMAASSLLVVTNSSRDVLAD
ncbi:MAG: cation-translocating P-type ATPase [Halobacteriales archaeon]